MIIYTRIKCAIFMLFSQNKNDYNYEIKMFGGFCQCDITLSQKDIK